MSNNDYENAQDCQDSDARYISGRDPGDECDQYVKFFENGDVEINVGGFDTNLPSKIEIEKVFWDEDRRSLNVVGRVVRAVDFVQIQCIVEKTEATPQDKFNYAMKIIE